MTMMVPLYTLEGKRRNYGQEAFWRRFHSAVKKTRLERGMTQKNLADAIGYSVPSISNIEAGKQRPDAFIICAIASALRVNPGTLLGIKGD